MRDKDIRKLTLGNIDTFFIDAKKGELFTYSFSFDYDSVEKMANRNNVLIKYNPPKTKEYELYGDTCCTIIDIIR